jgi:hypothetical protein
MCTLYPRLFATTTPSRTLVAVATWHRMHVLGPAWALIRVPMCDRARRNLPGEELNCPPPLPTMQSRLHTNPQDTHWLQDAVVVGHQDRGQHEATVPAKLHHSHTSLSCSIQADIVRISSYGHASDYCLSPMSVLGSFTGLRLDHMSLFPRDAFFRNHLAPPGETTPNMLRWHLRQRHT